MKQNIMGKLKSLPTFIKENIIAIITAVIIGRFGYCIIDDHFDVTNKVAKLMGYFFVFLFIVMMSYVYLHRQGIKDRLHKLYLLFGIIIGTMFLIMIPIFCVPDEIYHFKDAYHVSNEMLGIHDPDVDTLTMRVCDTKMKMNKTEYANPIVYAKYIRSIFSGVISHETDLVVTDTGKNYGADYLYIIPALGMTVARLLHLGSTQMFLLGRFFNLILFVLCMSYAIKKTPVGKLGFFGIGLLPIVLQQAASISYDVMINAFSIVVVALSLALLYEVSGQAENGAELKFKDYLIFTLTLGFLIPTKGHAYMLFALLPIWVLAKVWWKNYKENKEAKEHGVATKKLLKKCSLARKLLFVLAGVIVINLGVILVQKAIGVSGPAATIFEPHIIEWCDQEGYYVDALMENPELRFQVFYKTIAIYFDEYWAETFGNALGWMNIEVPPVFIYIWFLLMAVLFMKRKQEPMLTSTADKTVFGGIFALTIGFVLAGMLFGWTPMVYNYVLGVQGRYFIPVLALPLLMMRTKKIEIDEEYDGDLCFWALALTAMIVIFVFVSHDVKL